MTPDKNFKMSASIKTMLALGKFKDAHERGAFKRAMINAQMCEEDARRNAMKSKDRSTGSSE